MVVKIENTAFWVTPGLYQNKENTIKNGLDNIAATYGIKTELPELKGVFLLKIDLNGVKSMSLRNVYTVKIKEGELKKPNGIKW